MGIRHFVESRSHRKKTERVRMKPEDLKFLFFEPNNNGPKKSTGDVYKYYKATLAVFLVSMLAYGYHDQQSNPKDVHGSHFYTDYVSNWNDMSCSIWAVSNAILAFFPQTHWALYASASAFNAIAPTFSIGVAGAFWCLLPKERQSTDIVSLHQHAFLAIITVIDLIFTAAPIRWFHLFSTWIFAGCYALNTMIVFFIWGEDRDEIYPFLDYTNKWKDALKFDVFMTFGVQSSVFIFIFLTSNIKFFVHRKLQERFEAQVRLNTGGWNNRVTKNIKNN